MSHNHQPDPIWTPLQRTEIEHLLAHQQERKLPLYILYWLLWLPFLSYEELLRVLASTHEVAHRVQTKKALAGQISWMAQAGLIDHVVLHEAKESRYHRYYVTDRGIYLYLSVLHTTPPLSATQLAQAYSIERNDLVTRLATPHVHVTLSGFVTRLIVEGNAKHLPLLSYQQPWRHTYNMSTGKHRLTSDAALLIGKTATGTRHAFLVRVDVGPHFRHDRIEERFLAHLFRLRQHCLLSRQPWPGLLIITTQERLTQWAELLLAAFQQHSDTRPLSGAITTLHHLNNGVYTSGWWDLAQLPFLEDPFTRPCVPFDHLLAEPTSPELDELFSQQARFEQLLMLEALLPPPRKTQWVKRFVGESLRDEAAQLTAEMLAHLFTGAKKDAASTYGAGLLTLALTPLQKEILAWIAYHPLLDISTLLAILRPHANKYATKVLRRQLRRLFALHLVERATPPKNAGKRHAGERYLLTTMGLQFTAIRHDEPFYIYFVPQKNRRQDGQMQRQRGTHGLNIQSNHTRGLYHFMGDLFRVLFAKGERILVWKSAHDAARSYRESFPLEEEPHHIRPDAELVVVLQNGAVHRLYLEYDRATTGPHEYRKKFEAYASYELVTRVPLPLLLVVTPSRKAALTIHQVLAPIRGYYGSLPVKVVLQQEILTHGLTVLLNP